ncbi:MAG: flagellar FliJ family protein [Actinomycetota bacterium]|jgi:flagellar export protein FliJ
MSGRRLDAVLRIRELQERGARGELARSNDRHRRASDIETRTWALLDRASVEGPATSRALSAVHTLRRAGTLAADSQHLVAEHAHQASTIARDHWTIAVRRVEALERLAERTREASALEADRRQANEIDDLVLARRGRQTK